MNQSTAMRIQGEAAKDPRLLIEIKKRRPKNAKISRSQGYSLKVILRGGHRILTVGNWQEWQAIKDAWEGL